MSSARKISRIQLVDDHPVVRKGLRSILSGDPQLKIVAEAVNGEDALEQVQQLKLDVVLTDILMPGMSGIEVTRRIKRVRPDLVVILLTMYDSNTYITEGLRAGAAGYLVKDSSPEFLCHAVNAALNGGTIVSSNLLHRAIKGLVRGSNKRENEQGDDSIEERFTTRELDTLRLVAEGYTNREIAMELSLAEITVKKHVQNVISKMGVSDRTQAAISAARLGLVQ